MCSLEDLTYFWVHTYFFNSTLGLKVSVAKEIINYKPETFPQPGGPQSIREGISCVCRRDLSRVCSPISLFWPKYSSRVLGLKSSAKGLSLFSLNALGEDASDAAGPSGHSGFPITLTPGLEASGLSLHVAAVSGFCFWSVALDLVWNTENTAAAGRVSEVLVRAFLDGGPEGSCWASLLCKHSSKCALILPGSKSPAQTGHFTVPSDAFSAIVTLNSRVYPLSLYWHLSTCRKAALFLEFMTRENGNLVSRYSLLTAKLWTYTWTSNLVRSSR